MSSLVVIDADGTVKEYKPQKFQFKLDKARNSMVYGKGGYFHESIDPINPALSFIPMEFWSTSQDYATLTYEEGKFLYSHTLISGSITSITADCDKF